ncbi:MAG: CPBP family intramembrane metalloprotease [Arenimonas sp.]|nr:CPBP family intramembrane metalloprotease [Arenimonas sp.]MBP6309943.1 CPBP family intramembrane metalloprotease [Arenimonas sp.]
MKIRSIFLNSDDGLRNGWWIAIFFITMASLIIPSKIVADRNALELSIWAQAGLVILASLICQVLRREKLSSLFGALNTWPKYFIFGCLLGTILMLLPAIVLLVSGHVIWHGALNYSSLLPGLSLFAAVAIAEELVFRGFFFQRLISGLGQWPAQILMAAYFTLNHWDNPGMTGTVKILASINIFLASILFGLAYIRTQSLAMPIGLHLMLNFTQGTLLGFGVSGNQQDSLWVANIASNNSWWTGGQFGLEASLPGLLFIIMGCILLYCWKPELNNQLIKHKN